MVKYLKYFLKFSGCSSIFSSFIKIFLNLIFSKLLKFKGEIKIYSFFILIFFLSVFIKFIFAFSTNILGVGKTLYEIFSLKFVFNSKVLLTLFSKIFLLLVYSK